jgi:hypothetical protein
LEQEAIVVQSHPAVGTAYVTDIEGVSVIPLNH